MIDFSWYLLCVQHKNGFVLMALIGLSNTQYNRKVQLAQCRSEKEDHFYRKLKVSQFKELYVSY